MGATQTEPWVRPIDVSCRSGHLLAAKVEELDGQFPAPHSRARNRQHVMRHEVNVLPWNVRRMGGCPNRWSENATRNRLSGDGMLANSIGEHRRSLVVLRRVQQLVRSMLFCWIRLYRPPNEK